MNRAWPRELLGEWHAPDPKFTAALELWRAYDCETDAFDLDHGARVNDEGEVGPPLPWYQGASTLYARGALERLTHAALAAEIPPEVIESARRARERWRT